ncbi:MAG: hypothetical protein ACYSUT_06350 [Planctomycetota bacterium]|jgi:hypothetical protein
MKKVLVAMAVICGLVGTVNAVEIAGTEAAITVDATYVTKYIWRGYNVLGADSAFQPSVDLAVGNLSFNVWASYANGSGHVDATEYNYAVAYALSVAEDSAAKTDLSIGYRYYDFIKISSKTADMQEIFVEAAMPELVGGGVTPRIAWYQMWEGDDGSNGVDKTAGAIFDLGVDYDFTLEQAPELPMTASWDVVYNDGVGGVDHDWSHMVFGLATAYECEKTGGTFTPGIYYQCSWEDDINTSDELWAALSYSLTF